MIDVFGRTTAVLAHGAIPQKHSFAVGGHRNPAWNADVVPELDDAGGREGDVFGSELNAVMFENFGLLTKDEHNCPSDLDYSQRLVACVQN